MGGRIFVKGYIAFQGGSENLTDEKNRSSSAKKNILKNNLKKDRAGRVEGSSSGEKNLSRGKTEILRRKRLKVFALQSGGKNRRMSVGGGRGGG